MATKSNMTRMASDWQTASYGDVGVFAGVGAKLSHHAFHSPSLKFTVKTSFLQVGFGAGVDFKFPEIGWINNAVKAYDTAKAMAGYSDIVCHCSFSASDISGALADAQSGALILGDGPKAARISARGNGLGPAGASLLFTMPFPRTKALVKNAAGKTRSVDVLGEKGYGASVEASVTAGVFIVSQDDWLTEKGKRDFESSKNGIIYRMDPGKI